MKKTLPVIFLLLFSFSLQGQPFGNEWIDYSQKYYFFKVSKSDVYRISATTLANAGIPVGSINHSRLQLFGRGEQVPLFIKDDGTPNVLDGSDYIEFYAQANDGYFDANFYKSQYKQPNPYYSHINDTAIYYVTWGNSTNNERMAYETAGDFSSFSPSGFFLKEIIQSYTNTYYSGEPIANQETDVDYTNAQGWFNSVLGQGSTTTKSFLTENIFPAGPNAIFKTVVIGASKDANAHQFQIDHRNSSGSFQQLHNQQFNGYEQVLVDKSIPSASLHSSSTDFRYQIISGNRTTIAWASLKFPHNTNLSGANSVEMGVPNHSTQLKTYYEFSGFNAPAGAHVFDLTNGRKILAYQQSGDYRVLIPNGGGEKKCILKADNSVTYINDLSAISGSGNFRNLSNLNADYLIITATPLWNAAKEYEFYRRVKGFKAEAINVEDLYHQFAHGIFKNPLAIKNFVAFAFNSWAEKPEYLLLIGKSITENYNRKNSVRYAGNLVPSFGSPSSDVALTSGINGTIQQPSLATGRIAARNLAEVRLYLEKVKQHESNNQPEEWMKNVLHFGGGTDAFEQSSIKNYLGLYHKTIEDTSFGGKVTTYLKTTAAPMQMTLAEDIRNKVNGGVSIMTFFGHSGGSGFDINIDAPQNYDNKGKYPLLIANSCFTGNIHHFDSESTSEEFVLIPDKGVIGFLAKSGLGFSPALNLYTNQLYKNLGQLNYGESLGKSIQKTIGEIQSSGNPIVKNVCELMALHGDPAIIINSFPKPDLKVSKADVFFTPGIVSTDMD
nr:hypothetical protein [Bacteroidota bacterium]